MVTARQKRQILTIGTTEFAVLPKHSQLPVPAKIDTGADGSSIWATDIVERDGSLSFVLFAPNSAYYTGEVVRTRKFTVIKVKNSFGVDEIRYRVWLSITIAEKRYRASFTLANRANSRFPILIGKRFLKGRFVVDVSQRNLLSVEPRVSGRVIVLTSRRDQVTKNFFAAVAKRENLKIDIVKYHELTYRIGKDGSPNIILPDGQDIASAALVYFKAYRLYPEHALAIAQYLKYRHVKFIDKELEGGVSRSKLSEMFLLACNGISVPESLVVTSAVDKSTYYNLTAEVGTPFILKDAFSDRGKNNFYIVDEAAFLDASQSLTGKETLIAQRYIPNNGFYRVLVMGETIAQVVWRASAPHSNRLKQHLNKPAGSANAVEHDPSAVDSELLAIARRAALAARRNIAGIDLIQDTSTKKWYVLEVNYNPEMLKGIGIERKQQELAAFIKSEVQGQ